MLEYFIAYLFFGVLIEIVFGISPRIHMGMPLDLKMSIVAVIFWPISVFVIIWLFFTMYSESRM